MKSQYIILLCCDGGRTQHKINRIKVPTDKNIDKLQMIIDCTHMINIAIQAVTSEGCGFCQLV